jgi:hypothetical protein
MDNLFLVYFVNLYIFLAYLGLLSGGTTVRIQQLVLFILFRSLSVAQSTQDNRQSSKKNNTYQLLYTYGFTSWWWAYIRPKRVEVDEIYTNKLCIKLVFLWTIISSCRSTKHKICIEWFSFLSMWLGYLNDSVRLAVALVNFLVNFFF